MTTSELIKGFMEDHDSKKFDALYEGYYINLVGFLHRKCGNYHLAQDLAQDVFIIAYKEMIGGRYKYIDGKFFGWLTKIGRNLYINNGIHSAIRLDKERVSVTKSMTNDGLCDIINSSMDSLPVEDREILAMKFKDGDSNMVIGCAIGVSESTARRRVKSSVESLKEEVVG